MFSAKWRSVALISRQALAHNVARIRSCAPKSRILAVVKANAYGHGLQQIATCLKDKVDGFAVATLEEGKVIRQIDTCIPIVVLSELFAAQQLAIYQKYNLQPVIHCKAQLGWFEKAAGVFPRVWIKVDSGMNRLGFALPEFKAVHEFLQNKTTVNDIGVMSHLANADDLQDEYSNQQIAGFEKWLEGIDAELSMANSAGILGWSSCHFHFVRPGLALYGISPFVDYDISRKLDLKLVMTLLARVLSIKTLQDHQPVGYGGDYITRKTTRIATVGFGYGDGYPRNISERAYVLIRGQPARIIGRVSMDMVTVDISSIQKVELGDEVQLWGRQLSVETVSRWASTLPYELLCKVTPRTPRVLV